MDEPNQRKDHSVAILRTGGPAMAAGLVAGLTTALALGAFAHLGEGLLSGAATFIVATTTVFGRRSRRREAPGPIYRRGPG